MEVKRISPVDAKALLDGGYTYVDVRTTEEFARGHVAGAKNIPYMERDPDRGIMTLNPEFTSVVEKNFGKDAKLICGCQMGGRSFKATQALLAAGFQSVLDMRGGYGGEMDNSGSMTFPGWASLGLPTSTESTPESRYEHLKAAAASAKR